MGGWLVKYYRMYALERDKNITPFASEIESPGPRVIETAFTCTKVNAAWADHINEDHTAILGLSTSRFRPVSSPNSMESGH